MSIRTTQPHIATLGIKDLSAPEAKDGNQITHESGFISRNM